jgi:hypothetical protein
MDVCVCVCVYVCVCDNLLEQPSLQGIGGSRLDDAFHLRP